MDKEKIQKRVIDFFQSRSEKPLNLASIDCCSEMARLVGCWLISENPALKGYILKGEISEGKFHDILAILDKNVTLIDPTIWQTKKDAKSIFIGEVSAINEGLSFAVKYYGGEWEISEEINQNCLNDQDEYEEVLNKMISGD